MKYRFLLTYTPTDVDGEVRQREVHPSYSDDIAVVREMENDEWYSKRRLDGRLTFERGDYGFIMGCPFDGTFTLRMDSSTNDGASWHRYFEGTFSRANLEIDEDNQNVVLNGLSEGGEYDVIENGKSEEYDLMKIIPDSEAKEVRGEVHSALALVDYRSTSITKSDMFCGGASVMGGYKESDSGFSENEKVTSTGSWNLIGIFAEAKVEMKEGYEDGSGIYVGELQYTPVPSPIGGDDYVSLGGVLYKEGDRSTTISIFTQGVAAVLELMGVFQYGSHYDLYRLAQTTPREYSPSSIELVDDNPAFNYHYKKIIIYFHYIRATLLTQAIPTGLLGVPLLNVLDTGDYYKGMRAFDNQDGGLVVKISSRTVEQPNGHRLIPGTGERGEASQYFAPPDDEHDYIPLAEDNWNYGSLWYTIEPSVENGLLNRELVGTFRWARCWTLGTCLDWLLRKISGNKVTFDQSEAGSEFLYAAVNPLTGGERFEYLFTQKSNVMRPSTGGEGASRCTVRLDWFMEFMRNGLNCYWWLEERTGGTYAFRVEHVEWFRRGGSYTGQMEAQFVLPDIKPTRNFRRGADVVKRLDDGLHKYSYDLNGMTEKYTFSWQGDGGSDDFRGHPMFFKAGWVEKGSSESHEVDNIFADLSWLMLNAGTSTESSKNYDGLFLFSGYRISEVDGDILENATPTSQYLTLASGVVGVDIDIWLTVPEGQEVRAELVDSRGGIMIPVSVTGTGKPQCLSVRVRGNGTLRVNFGAGYADVVVHRIHGLRGDIYRVPNVDNLLRGDESTLQNGPLAWPWLQCEYLHYDIPAQRWSYDSDDIETATFEATGTVKLRKKQDVPLLPLPTKSDEDKLDKGVVGGLRDSQGVLQTGIVKSATVNLGTRNAVLELMYDMIE